MMKKKFGLLVLIALIVGLMAMSAYATVTAVTVTVPAASATVKGTAFELNGTYTDADDTASSLLNVTVRYGPNSGDAANVTCYNGSITSGNGRWNCKMNFNDFNDNASMILNISVGNQTNIGVSTTVTVENDDTDPVARFATQERNARVSGTLPADCSASSDNLDGSLTYQMNLVKPGSTNPSTVLTASKGSFSGTDIDMTGTYTLYCTVQDNSPDAQSNPASANSHQTSISINVGSSKLSPQAAEAVGAIPSKKGLDSKTVTVVAGAVVLLLFLGGGTGGAFRRR